MKLAKSPFIILVSLLCLVIVNITDANTAFSGKWYSYDGRFSKPRSIVKCYRKGNSLIWRIAKVFPNEKHPERRCIHCRGKLKNKPLVGMTVLTCPLKSGRKLKGCYIFNPDNGRHYKSELWLSNNNKILNVRAYLEIPILGKTVQWRKVR